MTSSDGDVRDAIMDDRLALVCAAGACRPRGRCFLFCVDVPTTARYDSFPAVPNKRYGDVSKTRFLDEGRVR
jgi:hypothetical protein